MEQIDDAIKGIFTSRRVSQHSFTRSGHYIRCHSRFHPIEKGFSIATTHHHFFGLRLLGRNALQLHNLHILSLSTHRPQEAIPPKTGSCSHLSTYCRYLYPIDINLPARRESLGRVHIDLRLVICLHRHCHQLKTIGQT